LLDNLAGLLADPQPGQVPASESARLPSSARLTPADER
jgi:hypothetical protein